MGVWEPRALLAICVGCFAQHETLRVVPRFGGEGTDTSISLSPAHSHWRAAAKLRRLVVLLRRGDLGVPCSVPVAPQQPLPACGLAGRPGGRGRCCGNAIAQHSLSLQRAGRDGQNLCSVPASQPPRGSGMPAAPPQLVGTPLSRLAPCASHGEGSWGAPGAARPAARRGCGRREARGLGSACELD